MGKLQKIAVITFLSFAFLFFILYTFLGRVEDGKPKTVEYPPSTLSTDIFDSQNTAYVQQEFLPSSYTFKTVPYTIDVMEGRGAEVNNGHFVYGNEAVTFYFSETPKEISPHETVLSEYANVVYLNYAKDSSYIQTAFEEAGYINGYLAQYFIDRLLISTGQSITTQSAYVIGYIIDLGEEYDNFLIVSIATTEESTENLAICKEYVDAMMGTLRFDQEVLEKREREAREAEDRARRESQTSSDVGYSESYSYDEPEPGVSRSTGKDLVLVNVDKDFSNLALLVTWTNPVDGAEVLFKDETGRSIGTVLTSNSTQTLIDVGACPKGTYYVSHSDAYNAGQITVKLTGN